MISPQWFQEIANDLNLPPLPPPALQLASAAVESDVKRVIELAWKIQKRSKKSKMTVDDVNLALSVLHQEHIYGLSSSSLVMKTTATTPATSTTATGVTANGNGNGSSSEFICEDVKVNLADYIAKPLTASCPQNVDVNLHWLAVEGTQPRIPENPELVYYDASADTSALPREMAYFYSRVTEALLSGEMKSVENVCTLLADDPGIHDLCGYFSRFIFVHIRRNLKNTTSLLSLLRAVESLATNPHVNLEPCLHQILPSVLTCVVASRLGPGTNSSSSADSRHNSTTLREASISSWGGTHYDIRLYAAKVVSVLVQNYSESYPDLLPRVCKTYLEAVDSTDYLQEQLSSQASSSATSQPKLHGSAGASPKSVGTVYGGIVGLGMLGERVISSILLSNFTLISQTLSILATPPSPFPAITPTSSPSPSFTLSNEPTLKKQRTAGPGGGGVQEETAEGSTIQSHGFTDETHTRYIVPSYTATSPSITASLAYIQMIHTQNEVTKEQSLGHRDNRNLAIDPQIEGKGLCEYALMNILGWYIMKSLSSAPQLRNAVLSSSHRKATGPQHIEYHDWPSFIDQRGELFVPYYVSVSQELDYCKLFL